MDKNLKAIVAVGLILFVAVAVIVVIGRSSTQTRSHQREADSEVVTAENALTTTETISAALPMARIGQSSESSEKTVDALEADTSTELTAGNFESFVNRCFEGEACTFADDPKKIYDRFKQAGNRRANDLLISFLRKNLKSKKFRERYKETLMAMIEDFYEPEELPFQVAAFHNYLGDLEKSLELYLALERKSQFDHSLRPATETEYSEHVL